jgi:hypothetical protein
MDGLKPIDGDDLVLLGTVPGSTEIERQYHQRFAHLREQGEWFRADPELLTAIDAERSAPLEASAMDYHDAYKGFREVAKQLPKTLEFSADQVLFRLNQLSENRYLPADIRDWHLQTHLDGLKEAMEVFERMRESAPKN